jgi:recombination protein RecA
MINQLRDKIGSMFVSYNTPGGRAFKHACSQRIFFHKAHFVDVLGQKVTNSEAEPKGNVIDIKVEKNKVSKFDRRLTSMMLMYDKGFDVLQDTIDLGLLYGVIMQGGKWYYIRDISPEGEILDEKKIEGKSKLVEALTEDGELFQYIADKVSEKIM